MNTKDNQENNSDTQSLKFQITMHTAYEFLEKGIVKPDEFRRFLSSMYQKYQDDGVRRQYKALLDLYCDMNGYERNDD